MCWKATRAQCVLILFWSWYVFSRLQDKKKQITPCLNTVIKYYFAACCKCNQQKCWVHTDVCLLSPHTAALRHTHSNMMQRWEATRFRSRCSPRRRWLKWSFKGAPARDNESDCKCIHASRWRENSRAATSLSNDCASFTVCEEEGEKEKKKTQSLSQQSRHPETHVASTMWAQSVS